MEQLLVLFLIFTLGEDPAMKEKFKNFLKFYRENRELIAMIAKNGAPMSEERPAEIKTEPQKDEKNRPLDGAGDLFEELLNRLG